MSDDDWAYNNDDQQFSDGYQDFLSDDDGLDTYLEEYVPEKKAGDKDEDDDEDIEVDDDIDVDVEEDDPVIVSDEEE